MSSKKVPEELQYVLDGLTPMQKNYCEWRARGLSQSKAAAKAGSTAKDKPNLSRVGFQIEKIPGVKDYIDWLKYQRIASSTVDSTEVILMLKNIYEESLKKDKYREANEAVKTLATVMGLIGKSGGAKTADAQIIEEGKEAAQVKTEAFKEEDGEEDLTNRLSELTKLVVNNNLDE